MNNQPIIKEVSFNAGIYDVWEAITTCTEMAQRPQRA